MKVMQHAEDSDGEDIIEEAVQEEREDDSVE